MEVVAEEVPPPLPLPDVPAWLILHRSRLRRMMSSRILLPHRIRVLRREIRLPRGDYVLTFDDTFSGDETLQQLLTETGKAHGLPVEGLSAFIKDMDARLAAKATEQKQAQDAAMEEAWRQLDGEWGRDSDARQMRAVQMAGRLCRMAGIDQSVFNEMGIADHPAMYRILDAVGRILDEPALPAPPGRQEQQARGEARRMMHDPEHPDYSAFHDCDHPRFAEVRAKYMRLMGA